MNQNGEAPEACWGHFFSFWPWQLEGLDFSASSDSVAGELSTPPRSEEELFRPGCPFLQTTGEADPGGL